MICLQYDEVQKLMSSIEDALPYLETAEFEGEVEDEIVEQLSASYEMLLKLVKGI